MNPPRFYNPSAALGERVRFPADAARHARDVLRLRVGAEVRLFDGQGHEFTAQLVTVGRGEVSASISAALIPRAESPLHLTLAVAPLKGGLMDLVIQKATELGVAEIWPLLSTRADTEGRPALQGARQERWTRIACAAAEQCGRARVPRIGAALTLQAVIDLQVDGRRLFCAEGGAAPCADSGRPRPQRALCLVGPAGGWTPAEAAELAQRGFESVSLGPRTLRAETAAIAAVALLQSWWGDLGHATLD
jgi:16S rRNA (uracil1498-N3)-methyltransferase